MSPQTREMVGKLETLLADAKGERIRSLVLVAIPSEGEDSECWARIRTAGDGEKVRRHLRGLLQDMGMPSS